ASEKDIKNYIEYQRSLPEETRNNVAKWWKNESIQRPDKTRKNIDNYWAYQDEQVEALNKDIRQYRATQIKHWQELHVRLDDYFEHNQKNVEMTSDDVRRYRRLQEEKAKKSRDDI